MILTELFQYDMISFLSGDGTPLTGELIYDGWRSSGKEMELALWLWEQVNAGT